MSKNIVLEVRAHHLIYNIIPGLKDPNEAAQKLISARRSERLATNYPEQDPAKSFYYADVIGPIKPEIDYGFTEAELLYAKGIISVLERFSHLKNDTEIILTSTTKDMICQLCYAGEHCGIVGESVYGNLCSDFDLILKIKELMGDNLIIDETSKSAKTTWGQIMLINWGDVSSQLITHLPTS